MRYEKHKKDNREFLKDLSNSEYGLPRKKKFPLNDKKHVLLAIEYFNSVKKEDEEVLAKNIFKRMASMQIPTNVIRSDSRLNYYSEGKDVIMSKNKTGFERIFITDKIIEDGTDSRNYIFSKEIVTAIKNFLKSRFIGMEKLKLNVYTFNNRKNINETVFLGNINVFTFNDYNHFDWDWNIKKSLVFDKNNNLAIRDNEKIIKRKNQYIINDYCTRIINLGKKKHIMLIPRLSFDVHNNLFMRFQKRDRVYNTLKLDDILNENTYVVSDLHFGKYSSYDDNLTITYLNDTIQKEDVLIILGDLSHIKNINKTYLSDCVLRIKCENIILILGNHDIFTLDFYYKIGIKSIYERFYSKKYDWLFSHQPCNGKNDKEINFHGHLHGSNKYYENIINTDNKINCFYKNFEQPPTIKELIERNKKLI